MRRAAGVLLLLSALSAGCGYSATRLLDPSYRTVYVAPFRNEIPITAEVSDRVGFQTSLPDLEERVTRGLIDRFLFDGNLRVTTNPSNADLLLDGVLIDFYRQPVRVLDNENVEEYRLNLVARVTLNRKDGKPLWGPVQLIGDTTYLVSGSSAVNETSAVDGLVTDFSRRVVERVLEDW